MPLAARHGLPGIHLSCRRPISGQGLDFMGFRGFGDQGFRV